jgi:glycosyltransferase involved in cell wall biosynthesis
MRILHLSNELKHVGNGITHVLVDLALEQATAGHDVRVATSGGDYEATLRERGIVTHHVELRFRNPLKVLPTALQVKRLIKENDVEIVHAHTITATVIARVAVGLVPAGPRVIATIHNEYQRGVLLMYLFAHFCVGVTEAVSRAIAARGISTRKIGTVMNGAVGSMRLPMDVDVPTIEQPAIVFCGGVSHRKGADVAVAAVLDLNARGRAAHLYLVGNVDWEVPVELAQSSAWGDRIHFVGFQTDPRGYMRAATVFVLPSRREPLGLVLLEAMAQGVPAVGTLVDGIPEVLDFGRAGLLVQTADVSDLVNALAQLLDDPEAATALAARGSAHSNKFTTRAMYEQYLLIYHGVARR